MKILYCNPIFLDYRIPFYKRLNELTDGEFKVLYSVNRYKGRYDSLLEKIPQELGDCAVAYDREMIYNTYTHSFKVYDSEKGQRIPVARGLLSMIRKQRPDVLITEGFFQWTPIVMLYAILFRKPMFIGYERTMWTERNIAKWKVWQRKFTDVFTTGYLVNGSETKKYLMSIGVKDEKIHIGGMSADSNGLKTDVARFKQDILRFKDFWSKYHKASGLMFLFCGQMVERKGVRYLLDAWVEHVKVHKDDSLVLVGRGNLLEGYKDKYMNVPNIFFEGFVPYVEVYKYYAVADVFVIPTKEDNWSLVVPEAMACGLPIATSRYNGCYPELVPCKQDGEGTMDNGFYGGENGCVFDTFKKDSIVKALDYFHGKELKSMGEKSIELEIPFNTENSALRQYHGIVDGLKYKAKNIWKK